MKIKTQIKERIKNLLKQSNQSQRRFRRSIYIDVLVPATDDLQQDRRVAQQTVKQYRDDIPGAYVGGVRFYSTRSGLDKQI